MKRLFKKVIAVALCAALVVPMGIAALAAESSYTIDSPYKNVDWDTYGEYKGNLHTHSTISDASTTMVDMITEYYEQGFDFLAMSEHGVTGKAWNVKPTMRPLYLYQRIIGLKQNWLTDEQYNGMTSGSYPLASTKEARGKPMVCVTGANELNAVALTKSHVNGFFLPEGVGDANIGYENGFEYAVKLVDDNGGLSHINHPGDWLESRDDFSKVSDPETIDFFKDIFLKYDSCLGMEVFNGSNSTTPYDRVLWDNLLMAVLPYGRTVTGFSNSDAHDLGRIDTTFSVFMMKENTVESIKATMQSGEFFCVSRTPDAVPSEIGPDRYISAENQGLPYPMFTKMVVDDHTVTVDTRDATQIQWIADGKVILKQALTDSNSSNIVLNLDEVSGSKDFTYIRAELLGAGGMCLSQAFPIDDGSEPLVYEEETNFLADLLFMLKSTRLYVIFAEIYKAIAHQLKKG